MPAVKRGITRLQRESTPKHGGNVRQCRESVNDCEAVSHGRKTRSMLRNVPQHIEGNAPRLPDMAALPAPYCYRDDKPSNSGKFPAMFTNSPETFRHSAMFRESQQGTPAATPEGMPAT